MLCSFLTRTGFIGIDAVAVEFPDVVADAARQFAGVDPPRCVLTDMPALTAWALEQPLAIGARHVSTRVVRRCASGTWRAGNSVVRVAEVPVPVGEDGVRPEAVLVAQCRSLLADGYEAIWLTAPSRHTGDRSDDGCRAFLLAAAEQVRLVTGAPVGIDLDHTPLQAFEALLTGRTDLVRCPDHDEDMR